MASDDHFLFCPLGCLSFSLWPLITPLSFVHWVVCPSHYDLWWPLFLLSIGLSVLLFMASDDTSFFCLLGCLSVSLWPLMTPFSLVHWVVCPSLCDLWWPRSLLSIGLSVLLFMSSDDPFLFCPLGCLSFSLWPLMTPFSFFPWVFCPSSLYGLWWTLCLLSIGLSVLLFMASDDTSRFCPLGCLSFFSLWPLMTPFSFVYLGCPSFFSLWPLMSPFSFVHCVFCPSSLYGLWWTISLLPIGISALLLFMASDDPSLFVHWVVCPSLYDLWRLLSLLSIALSILLFMALINPFSLSIGLSVLLLCVVSDDPSLFCPLGFLSFSLWPLMSPFSFVHWAVCPSSLYDLSWRLSLLSIESSVLLFMASDDPFLCCPLGCLSFSLWPLMTTFSFVHWVFCPLYGLWWPLSLCPLGCLSFSLWPLKTPFSFVHWVVCPSLYGSD